MINTERQQVDDMGGKPFVELLHKNFMAKVPQVLGEEIAAKFLAAVNVRQPNGGTREYPAYVFHKREAALLAMSYSYVIQARVWDRMTLLEDQARQQAPAAIPTNFVEALRLALEKAEEVERVKRQGRADPFRVTNKNLAPSP